MLHIPIRVIATAKRAVAVDTADTGFYSCCGRDHFTAGKPRHSDADSGANNRLREDVRETTIDFFV